MRFKIVRLTAIRNGPKWTIFVYSRLELLQLILECDIPYWLGEENKTPFIRVWKPFPNRRVLKP